MISFWRIACFKLADSQFQDQLVDSSTRLQARNSIQIVSHIPHMENHLPNGHWIWEVNFTSGLSHQISPDTHTSFWKDSQIHEISVPDDESSLFQVRTLSRRLHSWCGEERVKVPLQHYLRSLALADTPVFKKINIFFEWIGRNLFWMNNFWIEWDPLKKNEYFFESIFSKTYWMNDWININLNLRIEWIKIENRVNSTFYT